MKYLGFSFREKITKYAVLERADDERFQVIETCDIHAAADALSVLENYAENGLAVSLKRVGDSDFSNRASTAVRERCQRERVGVYTAPKFRTIRISMFGLPIQVRWETVAAPGDWKMARFDVDVSDKHAAARHRALIVAAAARERCQESGFGIYTMPRIRTVKLNLSGLPIDLQWELIRAHGEWARARVNGELAAEHVSRWRACLLAAAVGREQDPAAWEKKL